MSVCRSKGKFRWFYTGNEVGDMNYVGDFNFVAGGPPGSGISAGTLVPLFFASSPNRAVWENDDAKLNQATLDAAYPFMDLVWVVDIHLGEEVFRVSDRNVYVEDEDGVPRFYEARMSRGPSINSTLGEWLSPNFEIGDVSLKLNNRDGFFNRFLPQGDDYTSWTGSMVDVKVGFGEKSSNYFTIFKGFVTPKKGIESTDEEITIKCYDQYDQDEVAIPALVFDEATYPFVDTNFKGKPIPYIYGDWTTQVESYGNIPVIISNATEPDATEYQLIISGSSLRSIGDLYLHRGNRKKDGEAGPIKLDNAAITKDPDNGRIIIPTGVPVLMEKYDLLVKETGGSGSTLNLITSSGALNFIDRGVSPGDVVTKKTTGQLATVLTVVTGQLSLSGGVTFAENDEYSVATTQYKWLSGDKFTVACLGKDVSVLSVNRIEDAGISDPVPQGLTLGLDGTYWFADDGAQKIYEVSFDDQIVTELDYADLNTGQPGVPAPTNITGLSYQTDNTLWFFDGTLSRIYRFVLSDGALGLSFTTVQVSGIARLLSGAVGLTIDDGNILYVVENSTGTYFKIDPFAPVQPTKVTEWNRTAFDAAAVDTTDLSADVSANNLVVLDRATSKVYRISQVDGTPVSEFDISVVSSDITFPSGISSSQDGTLFIVDRGTQAVYNYNEAADANDNPGFIGRDLLQKLAGKTADSFDLKWNQTCREDLSQFKARLYVNAKTTAITYLSKFFQQFNTSLYIRFGRYSLFHYTFANFRNDGITVKEGDIKLDSFNPSKEYNQYFNSASADYSKDPFGNAKTTSDTYISVAGIALSGKEIPKKFDMPEVYRREDVDRLMPLFVRLAAAEPEFVSVTTGFRFIFTQLNDFFRINFTESPDCSTGLIKGGRRFDMVPCFTRNLEFDLDLMSVKMKLWSLGTTAFGDFIPIGKVAGGEGDPIVLTNLGSFGYVGPSGKITAATVNSITLEDVGPDDAEDRETPVAGKAWSAGMVLAVVDATTHEVVEELVVEDVVGDTIFTVDNMSITPSATTLNSAGFFSGGHYLRHADYVSKTDDQKKYYCAFGKPVGVYPSSSSQETDEQRAGLHDFDDGRIPYVLHPEAFVPS